MYSIIETVDDEEFMTVLEDRPLTIAEQLRQAIEDYDEDEQDY